MLFQFRGLLRMRMLLDTVWLLQELWLLGRDQYCVLEMAVELELGVIFRIASYLGTDLLLSDSVRR